MRYLFYSLTFIIILSIESFCQNTEISGHEPDYANDTLIFYLTEDYITNTKNQAFEIYVNDTGYFHKRIELEKTIQAEVYLGIYKGMLFLEPGKNYQIKLPTKKEKQIEDILNPYFKETELYLGIYNSDKNELNFLVKKFDYFYDHYIEDNFYIIYRQGYNSQVDTFITKLSNYFEFADNQYFNDYMKYKFANLKMLSNERSVNFIVQKNFLNHRFLYNNVAYMELFNQVFSNYFSFYSQTKEGADIYSDIAKAKSIYHLKKTLDKNVFLANDTLKELIILKGLNDAFEPNNSGNIVHFPKPQLLQTLDSMIILTKVSEHKKIAENIKIKATANRLKNGDDAPKFELPNKNNELVSVKSLKGKYLYLCFYSSWNISCLQEIGLLNNIYKKHKDKIEIVTIFCDGTMQNMIDIIEENDYEWTFLFLNNKQEILKDYNIEVFPTYLLIDPYSKIILIPAPTPNDDFEQKFFKILNARG